MILQIAWRNIWRNKNRSLVVFFAVVVATVAVLFMMAFSWGMTESRVRDIIEKEIGHIQIADTNFVEKQEAKYTVNSINKIDKLLKADKRLKVYSRRVATNAMASTSRNMFPVEVLGVNKQEELAALNLDKSMVEGSFFSETNYTSAVIGEDLAEELKLKINDRFYLKFQSVNGQLVEELVKISGIFKTNNSKYNKTTLFVPIDRLRAKLGINNGYNQVIMLAKDDGDLTSIVNDYKIDSANAVRSWKEISPEVAIAIDSFDKSMMIIVFIFFFAVAMVVVNIMLMAVLERVRELGMLMAVGMNKLRVFGMIMLETVFLALIGLPVGMFLSKLLIDSTGKSGINLTKMYGEGFSAMGYDSIIYPSLPTKIYINLAITVLIIVMLAAILPAYRAVRLRPAEAVRQL
ncbi:MAG: ABC transporter permease [Flavobacteriales bacterium]|nr:ABC transporter permease [Flavobacteriales bacterium]